MSLTYPLVPPRHPVTGQPIILTEDGHIKMTRDGSRPATPEPMFHGVEMGQRAGDESNCDFVSHRDRMEIAASVARIIPALVQFKFGELPDLWFYVHAQYVVPQVTFEVDEDTGEWTGNWTTQADQESNELLFEDLPGMEGFTIENLDEMLGSASETRPSMDLQDAASVGTSVNTAVFQAALGHAPNPNDAGGRNNQQAADVNHMNYENANGNDGNHQNNNNNNNNNVNGDQNGGGHPSEENTGNANGASDIPNNDNNGSSRVDSNQSQHHEGVQQDEARTASPVGDVRDSHATGGCHGP